MFNVCNGPSVGCWWKRSRSCFLLEDAESGLEQDGIACADLAPVHPDCHLSLQETSGGITLNAEGVRTIFFLSASVSLF